MKYALAVITIVALTVGVYFWTRPRSEYVQPPTDCGAVVITTNECLEGVIIK